MSLRSARPGDPCPPAQHLWELEGVDTPNVLSPLARLEASVQAICEAVAFWVPRPHVVLLVTPLGHFSEEDRTEQK